MLVRVDQVLMVSPEEESERVIPYDAHFLDSATSFMVIDQKMGKDTIEGVILDDSDSSEEDDELRKLVAANAAEDPEEDGDSNREEWCDI